MQCFMFSSTSVKLTATHPMLSLHSVVAGIGHLVKSNISLDGNLQSLVSLLHQNAFTQVESLFLPLSLLLPSEMPGYSPE